MLPGPPLKGKGLVLLLPFSLGRALWVEAFWAFALGCELFVSGFLFLHRER